MTERPYRIVFLCQGNSVRSQIAEALLQRKSRGSFEVASAGLHPDDHVHPMVIDALKRAGIDWMHARPKAIGELASEPWDLAITLDDRASEFDVALQGARSWANWSVPDPASVDASNAPTTFWDVLNALSRRIDLLLAVGPNRLRDLPQNTPHSFGRRRRMGTPV